MEAIVEILFEFVGEILLQLLFELVARMGLGWWRAPLRPLASPWLAGAAYLALGAAAGVLSLWAVPALFITQPQLQLVNLVVTPLVAGAVMAALGSLRARHGLQRMRLDRLAWGTAFAFAMAAVRYLFGH